MNPDVSIMIGDTRFNFRVSAMIKYENKFLLHKANTIENWNFVGGRVKCGESSLDALKRELKEEINLNIKNPKLINVNENFYTYKGLKCHELAFIYFVELHDEEITKMQDFDSLDKNDKAKFVYHWFEKEEIKNLYCRPLVIYDLINQNCNTLTNVITKE